MEIDVDKLISRLHPLNTLNQIEESSFQAAAVLIPLANLDGIWNLLYTRRTSAVSKHAGEVSFPGGAWEKSDLSLADTAVREANEEIGLTRESLVLIGGMDPIKTITGFYVFPFVGKILWPFEIVQNKQEVENVFLIPLDWLTDPQNFYLRKHHYNGSAIRDVIHYRDFNGEHLWGFTAKLTQLLFGLLK